jgi:hypothetical protein
MDRDVGENRSIESRAPCRLVLAMDNRDYLPGGFMRYRYLLLAAAVVAAPKLAAQDNGRIRPELRPFFGAYVPAGGLRSQFKTAATAGLQGALEMNSNFHLLGTLAWTYGHNKFAGVQDDVTNIWNYDVGAELNAYRELRSGWLFRPFVGAGIGARTYDYSANLPTNTCTSGYASLGTEMQMHRIAYRVEGRSYLTCYEHPVTGLKGNRSDYQFSFGMAYHIF